MRSFLTGAMLACLYLSGWAQDIIPFELTSHNNLSIQVILNKKDTLHLMLHTASYGVDLTEATTARVKSLNWERVDTLKSWGGDGNTSRSSAGNLLQIGGLRCENIPVWEDKNSGQDTDGKFGINLFKGKVVEIDYDKKQIVIYNSLPKKVRRYEKLPLVAEKNMLFVEGNCRIGSTVVKNKFLIHSGYFGSILLDDQFVADNKLDERLATIGEKDLKDSFGHVIKTKKAILPVLELGNEKLDSVPVGFFPGAIGRQKMSILGGDVLRRFNIVIDAERQYIYLRSSSLKKVAYI